MKMEKSRSSLVVLLALLLTNCSSSTAEVTVELRPGAPSANIAKVEVKVTTPGAEPETTTLSGKTRPWTDSMLTLIPATTASFASGPSVSARAR
ncbi:hypothetical protein ATI61_10992 [Archangium gephyra]|uniref:Lipoprotein n=1 Tax=Archangium gephyra TaxID=48 RepID=A0AAC8TB87_9BACT|nr:hypothetical protein [Archangium gephyra]AKI99716.1 Hypothetical protein AA314_01343 [Archangium gephyra]REG27755.1 hypothetical protein ATI61_10992 [Archangium gephyra]